eukprot:CAMPEP_0174233482 /NCGR_PEP_ID=MMETSP0417-20130205/3505_1 /TAXON_ID=242541 /ORGANISM="Mayorella sp, Strain BSH-02190019" /LENGTH=1143 /DNA_ID=CAMNT_0015311699 /DNA_START=85 /DNA_END=3516 /DNA_ORIENTATION=+
MSGPFRGDLGVKRSVSTPVGGGKTRSTSGGSDNSGSDYINGPASGLVGHSSSASMANDSSPLARRALERSTGARLEGNSGTMGLLGASNASSSSSCSMLASSSSSSAERPLADLQQVNVNSGDGVMEVCVLVGGVCYRATLEHSVDRLQHVAKRVSTMLEKEQASRRRRGTKKKEKEEKAAKKERRAKKASKSASSSSSSSSPSNLGPNKTPSKPTAHSGILTKTLAEVMTEQRTRFPEYLIPRFLHNAIQYIIREGLGVEGVFRLCGEKAIIDQYLAAIDAGDSPDYSKVQDVCAISSAIKEYFRSIPEPLVPVAQQERLLSVVEDMDGSEEQKQKALENMKETIEAIHPDNLHTLHALTVLLYQVSLNSDINLMTASNLGVAIGPSLIWSDLEVDEFSMLGHLDKVAKAVFALVAHHEYLFQDLSEKEKEEQVQAISADEASKKLDYSELCKLLIQPGYQMITTMSDLVQSKESGTMAQAILDVVMANGCEISLLEQLIRMEVDRCCDETTLFRSNSLTTVLLRTYCQRVGHSFISPLRSVVSRLAADSLVSAEVNDIIISDPAVLAKNRQKVLSVTEEIINLVQNAPLPDELRELASFLHTEVSKKFPRAGYASVGGFLFLRYVCPSLIAPFKFNIASQKLPKNTHRMLLLASKIIQSLANGVKCKESYMAAFTNDFCDKHAKTFQNYVTSITSPTEMRPQKLSPGPVKVSRKACEFLHSWLSKNLVTIDELVRETASASSSSLFQQLIMILAGLPHPKDSTKQSFPLPKFMCKFLGHVKSTQCIASSVRHTLVWSADSSGLLRVWDAQAFKLLRNIETKQRNVLSLVASPLVDEHVWVNSPQSLQVWNTRTGEMVKQVSAEPSFSGVIVEEDTTYWSAGPSSINIFDLKTYQVVQSIPTGRSLFLAMSRVGEKHIWGGTTDRSIIVFDIRTFTEVKTIENAHGAKISSLVDAGNGFVWSASDSTTINVWNASNFELYKTFDAHKNKLLSLCRINARIWSCSWDQTIQLWDAETCDHLGQLRGYNNDAVTNACFVFNENERKWHSWTSSMDRSVCVWSMPRESAESMTNLRLQRNQGNWSATKADSRSRSASIGTFRALAPPPPDPEAPPNPLPTSSKVGRLADKVKQLKPPPPAPTQLE